MKKTLIGIAAVAAVTSSALADATHITPKAAFAETSFETQRMPRYVIDGSGIDETNACGIAHQYNMWMGKNSGNSGDAKFAKWFVVDLGAVYAIDRMKIWNFNMNNGASYASRGVKQIDIYVSTNDTDFSGTPNFSDASTWTLFKENHTVAAASGTSSYTGDAPVSFNGTKARWVGFWIDTLQASDAEYGGLSEVRFWESEGEAVSFATLGGVSYSADGSEIVLSGAVQLAEGVSSVDVKVGYGFDDGTQVGIDWSNTVTVQDCSAGNFSYTLQTAGLASGIYYVALGVEDKWSEAKQIPVGAALTTEWTGNGNGVDWNDAGNWSYGVPTRYSTALFGNSVSADFSVSVSGADAVARKVVFSSARKITIPSLSAFDIEVSANAVTDTISALTFKVDGSVQSGTMSVAADSRLVLGAVTGDASLVKTGAGELAMSAASARSGGTTEVREGTFVYSNNRQLGTKLIVGGGENRATAKANNNWDDNFNPFARGGCPAEVLANGFFDLASDNSEKTYHRENGGPIIVRSGGSLTMGNRKYSFATAGTTNLFIEGEVTYGPKASISLDCNTIAVSENAGRQVVLSLPISSQEQVPGKATFTVDDIPDVPVDLVVSGKLSFAWAARDGFYKRGTGVARFTNANTYGGGSADSMGWTRVLEGTLLVDNEAGSGTGNSRVSVSAGAVLGGTGRIGGLTETVPHWQNPNTEGSKYVLVTATGNEEAQAVIAPGTIDDETGAFVSGELTVGSGDISHPVTFGNASTLRIASDRSGSSRLTVYGKVTVSATDSVLDLATAVADNGKVKGGVYTILSATEGIDGVFATVVRPRSSWKVSYISEDVGGESIVKRIDVTVPGSGFSIVVR